MCWNTSGNPTISDTCTSDGTANGVFTSNITGLIPQTSYYVRAYATNSAGTSYGIHEPFNTGSAESNISIRMTVDKASVVLGTDVVFTITATNYGPDDATGVIVTDLLPIGLTYQSDTGGADYASGTGVWNISSLAKEAAATLTITASVDQLGTITNVATKTAGPQDSIADDDSYDASVTGVPAPTTGADIFIRKVVDHATQGVGLDVVFTITATNRGPDAATGVEVTDFLPPGALTWVSDDSSGQYDPDTGVWTLPSSLAAGASATLDITARVGQAGVIHNIATRTASVTEDNFPENDSYSAKLTGMAPPPHEADIAITNVVDLASQNVGSDVVFTITATNHGPDDATDVLVTESLPPELNYVSDDTTPGSGAFYRYSTGLWLWDIGNLARGDTATINVTARVDKDTVIANVAEKIASSPVDHIRGNDKSSALVTGVSGGSIDIAITKTVDIRNPAPESNVEFTIVATNNGISLESGVTVADSLPSGLTWVSDDSSGQYVPGTGVWTL
ncbi:MAG: DUF11 domain-containing protein, partial [Desulfobacterales bacterium]